MGKPTDKFTVEHLENKASSFAKKAEALKEKIMDHHIEKDLASRCKTALEKVQNKEELTTHEEDLIEDTRKCFPDVLEDTNNNIQEDISQINGLIDYLNDEIQSNTESWEAAKKIHRLAEESLSIAKAKAEKSAASAEKETAAESSAAPVEKSATPLTGGVEKAATPLTGEVEKSATTLETNVESSSESTKDSLSQQAKDQVNKSPSDYIDDLPQSYNPFDDMGTD